jgi:hypothetical protein
VPSKRRVEVTAYNPLGGSTAVGVDAEPAFKSRMSSEPAVTSETSVTACLIFFGSPISVTMMWMLALSAASSFRGPAVSRLRIRAKTWLVETEDWAGQCVPGVACGEEAAYELVDPSELVTSVCGSWDAMRQGEGGAYADTPGRAGDYP